MADPCCCLCIVELCTDHAGWDQSDTYVKIYITAIPGVDKINPDDVVKEFTKKYDFSSNKQSLSSYLLQPSFAPLVFLKALSRSRGQFSTIMYDPIHLSLNFDYNYLTSGVGPK